MAVFKSLLSNDITNTKSILNQLVDIVREDISGSNSRKSYEVFVTSSVGPGVTSSLYQTVFDQDFSLQTANSLFDVTFGFYPDYGKEDGATISINKTDVKPRVYLGGDTSDKKRYVSTSLMMREKQDIYRQFAATLLGSTSKQFIAPFGSNQEADRINAALFLSFHRLFVRDGIKRETFAMRMKHKLGTSLTSGTFQDNLFFVEGTDERIYTDFGASTEQPVDAGGNVGNIVYASNTNETVGLIFYDHGTIVLNAEKVFNPTDVGHGVISGMSDTTSQFSVAGSIYSTAGSIPAGKKLFGPTTKNGSELSYRSDSTVTDGGHIYPYFFTSGSVDDIVNHVCSTRFGSDAATAITFQNKTEINSSIYFIRALPDEFNYSSNPSYLDGSGNINVVPVSGERRKPFSYITTVGLYGNSDELLAVAKTSRPIEKNDEKDLTIRIRLDF